MVSIGLSVEKIMAYIIDSPKEEFINITINVASKWPTCPKYLFEKLQLLKEKYRVFKKFRLACLYLGEKARLDKKNNGLLSSFIWLVHLLSIIQED